MSPRERLKEIAYIIWNVDERCLWSDGPVTKTKDEITTEELVRIYRLAKGR